MTLTYSSATRSFALDAGPYSACDGGMQITLKGGVFDVTEAAAAAMGIDVEVIDNDDGAPVLVVRNDGDAPVRVDRLVICFAPGKFASPLASRKHRHLIHGGTLDRICAVKPVNAPTAVCDVDAVSDLVSVYTDVDRTSALLLGALPPFGDSMTCFQTLHAEPHMEGDFGIAVTFELGCVIEPGSEASTSAIVAMSGSDGVALLGEYADMMARRRDRPRRAPATGWNSWDYYAGAVRRADMDQNIAACRQHFGEQVRYMVIDEGYECQWGVWDAGWKFPEGLGDYCRHVRAAGYEPGVWTAPLMVDIYSPLFRDNPDWFASDAEGNVVLNTMAYGTMGLLDVTHPQVQRHLREVYVRLREAGFTYFKCDFAQELLKADRFHRGDIGRAKLVRMTFELIHESIGEDAYLLSAGAPFESVIGIVDACRITPDIAPFAANVCQNIRSMAARSWMRGAIGNIDPDFAIVRCGDTTDDPLLTRRLPLKPQALGVRFKDGDTMNLDEAKMLLLAIHLIGGDVILGDAIEHLNDIGIDCLKRLLSPPPTPGVAVNLFDPGGLDAPRFVCRTETELMVGCFNLTDEPVEHYVGNIVAETGDRASDFWTGGAVALPGSHRLIVAPRSAVGLRFSVGL